RWAMLRGARLAAPQRAVLAIDDLQRVDGSSRAAFADVLDDPPPGASLLVLATHTPGFDAGWSAQHAARVIAGLPASAVTRVLTPGRAGDRGAVLADVGVRGIAPLTVEQILRFQQEGGSDPPVRLADVVSHRLNTLEPKARRALQALGVLGDRVPSALLAEVIGKDGDVDASVDLLVAGGWVTRTDGLLSTSHPLIRELVLGAIPAGVRRELHARVVRAHDEREAPLEVRALHAFYAQDTLEALLLLEQVAERAVARHDAAAAVVALRNALELARQDVYRGELDDPMKAMAIFARKLGDALIRTDAWSDAEGVLQEAMHVAGPTGTERAHLLATLARVARGRERDAQAIGYIDQAIEVARRSGSHELVSTLASQRRAWAS
ncbi:MAG: hypothetical protein FJ104_09390, partial [Deltaproteobacteria bacterium]|nr:hypothetical protein [Deltaproteobacteria bacterium]